MDRVPTWRETGKFLTPAQLGDLTDDQRAHYYAESTASSFDEIDAMPEPQRTIFKRLTGELLARHHGEAHGAA